MHFLKKLWCSWIDLFQQAVFPCFLSLTSSHACTYASLIKQQATVCSVGLLLSVWLPPLSYCSSVLLECSRPSCACCEDRSYSGASPASGVGGEWLANHTQNCLLPSAQPGDRETGTETWQREIAGCRGETWGWLTQDQERDTKVCCSSGNCFILKGRWLCGKRIVCDSVGFADSCTTEWSPGWP